MTSPIANKAGSKRAPEIEWSRLSGGAVGSPSE